MKRNDPLTSSSTELGKRELAMRRLLNPDCYRNVLGRVMDRPAQRKIDNIVMGQAALRGSDFFVLQIGANDGVRQDPVNRYLETHDWQGLLVEPVPHIYEQLQKTYANKTRLALANVAISQSEGVATMYTAQSSNGTSKLDLCSSFDLESVKKTAWVVKNPEQAIKPVEVRTTTVPGLLQEYHVQPEDIDYLVVDAEGHDKVVLDQVDFENGDIPMVLHEHINLSPQDKTEVETRLQDNGFQLIRLSHDTFAHRVS